jgi:4-aminobutyrate aminotransferase-like enzyme
MPESRLLTTGLNSGSVGYGRIVGAEGSEFIMDDGSRLLDASNTAAPLGHRHPKIIEAIKAAAEAPVINEGWFWPDREEAAQKLIETAFGDELSWVGAVRFFLSGSEANDLALSLAQAYTGRNKLATRERAYHGMTGLSRDMTVQPQWHGGLSALGGGVRPVPPSVEVKQLPAPLGARFGQPNWEPSPPMTVDETAAELADVAAVIIDYTQGGVYYDREFQEQTAAAASKAGSLWIADEVVTGLGRQGSNRWFAFQGGDARPDIVTLGKPLAGGGAPGGAVVVSKEIAENLSTESWRTYSTFRGHPLTAAGTKAHLQVLAEEQILARVPVLEDRMASLMAEIESSHPSVVRIDGCGLHWTVELSGPDWHDWHGDVGSDPIASQVSNRAVEAGALIGTSGEQTSLFLAPPLIVTDQELEKMIAALDHGLAAADEQL